MGSSSQAAKLARPVFLLLHCRAGAGNMQDLSSCHSSTTHQTKKYTQDRGKRTKKTYM